MTDHVPGDPGNYWHRVRAFCITRWNHLLIACMVGGLLMPWPYSLLFTFLMLVIAGFGIGVLVVAGALADDISAWRRYIEGLEDANRKLVQRMKGRKG